MSDTVAVYEVRFRPHREADNWLPLGDIGGVSARDLVQDALKGLAAAETAVAANYLDEIETESPHMFGVLLEAGSSGDEGRVEKPTGEEFGWDREDMQWRRCVVMFRLVPTVTAGFMAIHIPQGKSVKTAVQQAIAHDVAERLDKRLVQIDPVIPKNVLRDAAENNRLRKIRLIAQSHPADEFDEAEEWVDKDHLGSIEIGINPKRNFGLSPKRILGFLDEEITFDELVRFEDYDFDRAKIEVRLANGRTRTINLGDGGASFSHPMTTDISAPANVKTEAGVADLVKAVEAEFLEIIASDHS